MKMTIQPLFAVALTGLAATSSHALPILIDDAGFEDDDIAANTLAGGSFDFTDWTETRTSLSLTFVIDGNALGAFGIAGAKSGDQYFLAHANGNTVNGTTGSSFLSQDTPLLWSELAAGDTLTVKAWTTYRDNVPGDADTTFSINAADGSGITSDAIDVTDGAAPGVWTEQTWSYVVTQSDIDTAALESWGAVNLQVGATYTTTVDAPRQVAFDDISLEYTPVPEPASLALIGLGGLVMMRRRRI